MAVIKAISEDKELEEISNKFIEACEGMGGKAKIEDNKIFCETKNIKMVYKPLHDFYRKEYGWIEIYGFPWSKNTPEKIELMGLKDIRPKIRDEHLGMFIGDNWTMINRHGKVYISTVEGDVKSPHLHNGVRVVFDY